MVPLALQRLVDAAIADGSIRADVESPDILHALFGIYSAPAAPDWQARSRRLVALLMDGLRWGAPKASRRKSARASERHSRTREARALPR